MNIYTGITISMYINTLRYLPSIFPLDIFNSGQPQVLLSDAGCFICTFTAFGMHIFPSFSLFGIRKAQENEPVDKWKPQ